MINANNPLIIFSLNRVTCWSPFIMLYVSIIIIVTF